MTETIKAYIAHRWGFITHGEHVALLEKNLKDFRRQAEHSIMVRERERLALHAENKALKDRVRDAEEELAFIKADFTRQHITRPTEISTGDF